jgi:serine phosphatase RsbU (regulator of sigma subunit)/anti-sigma regulatory factor (Ser/Thr protein kinase)
VDDEHEDLVATAAFQPEPAAVAAARRFVRETLNSWQLPGRDDLVSDAVLLTSELVTNAVVHAGTDIQVACRLDRASSGRASVEVSVLDRHPARMIPDPPNGSARSDPPGGRGLLLPGALSSSWGVTYAAAAKVVWFRLALRGRPDGTRADRPDQTARRAAVAMTAEAAYPLVADEDVEIMTRAVATRCPPWAVPAAGTQAAPSARPGLSEDNRAWRGRMSFLAESSHLLAGTLDEDRTIALAAQLVVPRLARWCAVLLPDEGGELRLAYAWHADESRADALTGLLNHSPTPKILPGTGAQRWSLKGTQPEQWTGTSAELASGPAWCLPLRARGRNLGVLVIGGAIARDALDLAEDLAPRAALALDNARLYSQQVHATHALQRSLLPPGLPDIPGVDLAAAYQPAGDGNEVGGDFYDVFEVAESRWRFAIGDVCGKGPEAAAVTGLTRHALRILAKEGHDVPAVLQRLNALIASEDSRVPFVTLIYGELVPAPGGGATISLACAGHPLPRILRRAGGVQAAARAQPLLGVLDKVTFCTDSLRLLPGDVLLCVTDGVTERRAACGRLLDDDDGLSDLLGDCSGLNAGAIAARIQHAADEFGSGPAADDQALIVLRGR